MANSGYYRNLYKQFEQEAEDYGKDIEKLEQIKKNLSGDLYDEQLAVNREINDLVEDLKKGVRHNSVFTNKADDLKENKEKSSFDDASLGAAISSLESEISVLQNKKRNAEQKRDEAKRKYEEEKERERQEILNRFFDK